MSKSIAGKGCIYRKVDTEKYNINLGFIYSPPLCECCGKPMCQWAIGKKIAYCNNKECDFYTIKIERM